MTLTYEWDLDGDGIFGEIGSAAGRGNEVGIAPTFSAVGLNGPGSYLVRLRVTDSFGASSVVSTNIAIINVAPTVTLTGPATATAGQTKHYTFTTTDPGPDTFSIVATGGGSVGTVSNVVFNSLTGADSFDVTFGNGPASSEVRVQLQDSDGAISNVSAVTVEVAPTFTLSGLVFSDFNNDGEVDFGERAIQSVVITLSNQFGTIVATTTTNAQGIYEFTGLVSGQYYITEQQPAGYSQGTNKIGTLGGTISALDQFFVDFANAGTSTDGLHYNFAERPNANGNVQSGQTASIAFWQNKNGQALIVALNGVGYSRFNVGTNGAAFGVANGSSVTVMDLLLALNTRTRRGLLFDTDNSGTINRSEQTFREMANTVFSGINDLGNI